MPFPSPEDLQYLLGIHPDQQAANAALLGAAQGDPSGVDTGEAAPTEKPEGKSEAAPQPVMSSPAPGPRGLDVPPVGTPGPVPGSAVNGVDKDGNPSLGLAADTGPVGTVPGTKADIHNISDLMTKPIRPVSGDQQIIQGDQAREARDRTELDRLNRTGSGVDQFMHRHRFLGPLVKGLSIAGSAISPGVAAMVPGTDLHHQVLVNQAEGRVGADLGAEKEHASIADHAEATASREQATQGRVSAANAHFIAGSEHEDSNSPTGYVAQTVGGEWKPYTPPASYKESKGEASEATFKAREKDADRLQLKGADRKFYIANGKLREPNQQADEDRKARIQRQREHDQDMRMQHYNTAHQRWAEHKSQIEKEQEQGYAKIENDWRKKYGPDGEDVLDKADGDKGKKAAIAELERQKALLGNSITVRFNELGPEPSLPKQEAAPAEEPAAGESETAGAEELPQAEFSPRTGAPIGGPVPPPAAAAKKPAAAAPQANTPGSDVGPAPPEAKEGRTGKLQDGTKVIVKGGRLVAQ